MFKFLLSTKGLISLGLVGVLLGGAAGWWVGDTLAQRTIANLRTELAELQVEYANYRTDVALAAAQATAEAIAEMERLQTRIDELQNELSQEKQLRYRESQRLTEELRRAKETGEGDDTLGTAMLNYLSQLRYYQQRYGHPASP